MDIKVAVCRLFLHGKLIIFFTLQLVSCRLTYIKPVAVNGEMGQHEIFQADLDSGCLVLHYRSACARIDQTLIQNDNTLAVRDLNFRP